MRQVPIAPELNPILLRLFTCAEPGSEAVVPRLRNPRMNLRTHIERIIARAGMKPWPRLFHNLRASCATDWVERFPNHAVASWLGHSPLIAATHYLQARDAHFTMATGRDPSEGAAQKAAQNPAHEAAQKAAQHASAPARVDSQDGERVPGFEGVLRASANAREETSKQGNGRNRTRTTTENSRETAY